VVEVRRRGRTGVAVVASSSLVQMHASGYSTCSRRGSWRMLASRPGAVTKLLYSEHARRSADDAVRVLGAAGMTSEHPDAAQWVERLLFAPGQRLGVGTDEIQRNAIAEQGIGLPFGGLSP